MSGRPLRCFAPFLVWAGLAAPLSAADVSLGDDGWYRWEVPAGAGGRSACCYEFRGGTVTGAVGCRLGGGDDDLFPHGDCEVASNAIHIYVEIKNGQARDIRALSSACPVRVAGELRTLDSVTTADSIAWLLRQVDENPRLTDESIMAVSFHAERQAIEALIGLVEDTRQRQNTREQALFWMVQSESDQAFTYLDRLLD